jgi:hypothetical protein
MEMNEWMNFAEESNKLSGVVNIPVADCLNDHCISPVGPRRLTYKDSKGKVIKKRGINPLCMSAPRSWDAEGIRAARAADIDKTKAFLNATGLYLHSTWRKLCEADRE